MDGIRRFSLGAAKRRMSDFTDIAYLAEANEGVKLSEKQKKLIKDAWKVATKNGVSSVGKKIFLQILLNKPDLKLKPLFKIPENVPDKKISDHPNFQNHAQIFSDVLGMVVESLDALDDSLGPLLVSYGNKHVEFQCPGHEIFTEDYWDAFSEAMCEVATEWRIKTDRIETLQTWRILVFFIVNKVRQGYEWQKRRTHTMPSRSLAKSLESLENL